MNIYVHIPFCKSKCAYCAFLSLTSLEKESEYFDALISEINSRKEQFSTGSNSKLESIYLGGGTPSLVDPKNIEKVIKKINSLTNFSEEIEITLEANPENVNIENLEAWKSAGVNRLSIGAQTLNNDVRNIIGRRLASEEVIDRIKLTQKYFENTGVDLIAGLPSDDVNIFIEGLNKISEIGVNHLSVYDLELDKDSHLAKNQNSFPMLDEVEREEFLLKVWEKLEKLGYRQYEISNFAKNNYVSKHNHDFWLGKDYVGFGLGAVSKIGDKIITNSADVTKYLEGNDVRDVETLSKNEFVNLQTMADLRIFKPLDKKLYGNEVLINLESDGLLENLVLTEKGKLLYNYVVDKLLQ